MRFSREQVVGSSLILLLLFLIAIVRYLVF
jgi:hypothetical protein